MRPPKYPQERLLTAVGCVGAVLIPFGSVLNFGGGAHAVGHPGGELHIGSKLLVGAALSFTGLALIAAFWRCPACKQSLQDKFNSPTCPDAAPDFGELFLLIYSRPTQI